MALWNSPVARSRIVSSTVSQGRALQLLKDGIAAAKAGDKPRALGMLREVVDMEPRNELAWLWLGGVAETPHDAVEALEQVLLINPANERAKAGLKGARLQAGIADARQGNKEEARRQLLACTELDPNNELAWLWLASVANTASDQVASLERVVGINPAHERAQAGLLTARLQAGIGAAQVGDKPSAQRFLQAAVEQEPRHEMAWLWLSTVVADPREAVHALEQVLKVNPKNDRAVEGLKYYKSQIVAAPVATLAPATTAVPAATVAPAASAAPASKVVKAAAAHQCPYCGAGSATVMERCGSCQAVLTLTQPEALLTNDKVNRDVISATVQRLEEQVRSRPDFQSYIQLGVGYANLRQYDQAVKYLQAAIRQRPADPTLRNQVAALVRKREAIELAARDKESKRVQVRPKTIMVVDDSPTVRKLVAITMERQGYRVVQAGDGYEAVEMIRRQGAPDMVLLDITMPGLDGYQLCKLIRQHPETKQIPVVLLSGKDGFFDKMRGRMAGSSSYITKPFKPEQLIDIAARYCPNGRG
jgi:twitching motility two-component system response regulator PilG